MLASTRITVVAETSERALLHRSALTAIRELRNMSQSELARQIDIAQSYISALERGVKGPDVPRSTALAIAGALGVPLDAICVAPAPLDQVAS